MKYCIRLLLLFMFVPLAYAEFKEGSEFEALAKAQPTAAGDKIEVLELFWYACPHCYHLEPELEKWLKNKPDDVVFVRVPAVLGPNWELLARAYYTADLLGVLDKVHVPLFERIHKERKAVRTVAELKAFFAAQGVPEKDFDNTFQSFAVITKTNRAKQVRDMYGISGVPALVVNGKYRTSSKMAGGDAEMLKVVDYLVEQERGTAAGARTVAQ